MSLYGKKLKDFSIFFFPSTAFSPTFSLAALFVSWSIQLMSFRPSSNADCTSATMSSTWWTKETQESHQCQLKQQEQFFKFYFKVVYKISPWPCCLQRTWFWQTELPEQSPGRCRCHWHTASSGECSSAEKQQHLYIINSSLLFNIRLCEWQQCQHTSTETCDQTLDKTHILFYML